MRPLNASDFGPSLLAALLAALAGIAVARSFVAAILAFAVAGAILCPRWWLLAGAIGSAIVLPELSFFGGLAPSDVLLGLYVLRSGVGVVSGRAPSMERRTNLAAVWLALFICWAWASLIAEDASSTASALGRISLYALVFLAASRDPSICRPLLRFLIALACFEIAFGIVHLDFGANPRLVGTREDPHELGIVILIALAAVPLTPSRWRWPLGAFLVAGLFLTFTRGIWAAAAVEIALFAVARHGSLARPLIVAALGLLLAVALVPLVTEQFDLNPSSPRLRQESIARGVSYAASAPVFGLGWALGGLDVSQRAAPYNLWVNLAASTGVPGMLFVTLFLGSLYFTLQRAKSRDEVRAVGVFLVSYCVLSASIMPFYAAGSGTILFFSVTGAAVAAARCAGAAERNPAIHQSVRAAASRPHIGGRV